MYNHMQNFSKLINMANFYGVITIWIHKKRILHIFSFTLMVDYCSNHFFMERIVWLKSFLLKHRLYFDTVMLCDIFLNILYKKM